MTKFNNGKPYHGSSAVQAGKLRGSTDGSDYFYFLCPKCPEDHMLRILEYTEHDKQEENPYNGMVKKPAKQAFTLAFHVTCDNCGFDDFVKLSNSGWQGGKLQSAIRRVA